MLSSTGVTMEDGSITFVVLGRVSNVTGFLSRLTPDVPGTFTSRVLVTFITKNQILR